LIVFRSDSLYIFSIIKLFFMRFKLSFFLFFLYISAGVSAQQVTQSFSVSGNCGMCKKKIEAAATKQGVTSASWDKATQMLTVSFDAGAVNEASIKQAIADAGYDADGVKASETVYESLPDCCKYRATKSASGSKSACCVKDGVCKGEKKCCEKNGGDKSCCANATCEKENGCCSKCEKGKAKKCCAADHKDKACDKKGSKDCCKKKEGCKSGEGCKH
jgi:mercuric ion binding protein